MSVKMRQEVERKIATAAVHEIVAEGYSVTVDYGDGESDKMRYETQILTAMFQGDEDRLYLYKTGTTDPFAWVYFVYGNNGWDVISDYTVNLESLLKPANKIADHYAD